MQNVALQHFPRSAHESLYSYESVLYKLTSGISVRHGRFLLICAERLFLYFARNFSDLFDRNDLAAAAAGDKTVG